MKLKDFSPSGVKLHPESQVKLCQRSDTLPAKGNKSHERWKS